MSQHSATNWWLEHFGSLQLKSQSGPRIPPVSFLQHIEPRDLHILHAAVGTGRRSAANHLTFELFAKGFSQ